ncbi:hypothetical protein F7725_000117 [Dissostichus mawsoni]|uniref:Uncharacterized protein n=1 Tax=Dissostichus mawsoni TaxID=36200 RepID=A0A7J5ZDE9_DISMA|nr:hypothetical protein F7725_000117 [Dissostichus mawsoni]
MNVYYNVESLASPLIVSTKENGRVYNQKPKTGPDMTNLVMFIPPLHGKMGREVITCISHVISQCHLQTSLKKLDSAKTKKVLSVRVKHQVLKCKRINLCVMIRQRDHCHLSACVQQWVGLSMTELNVYGCGDEAPNRVRGTLFRLNTHSAWRSFKRHPVLIEDVDLRDRLTRLIESTSDPFANDIMYHHACWRKYVNHTHFKPDDAMHLQNVSLSEARNFFFRHVDSIIFTEREIRSLQSLLAEYKRIVGDYGYEVGDVKSSYVKACSLMSIKRQLASKREIK